MGDKEPLLLNILTSVLWQFESYAIIWRQTVLKLKLRKGESLLFWPATPYKLLGNQSCVINIY